MFTARIIRIVSGVIFAGVMVVTFYFILDIVSPYDGDPCNPLICTPGYPCFDQGNCTHMSGE